MFLKMSFFSGLVGEWIWGEGGGGPNQNPTIKGEICRAAAAAAASRRIFNCVLFCLFVFEINWFLFGVFLIMYITYWFIKNSKQVIEIEIGIQ